MKTRECYGCKGIYAECPDLEAYATYGVARYGVAIPECMAAISDILVRENQLYGYPRLAHRLIVDACGLQHPPHHEIQKRLNIESRFIDASIQSVWIHGLGLYCILERKMTAKEAGLVMKQTLDRMKELGHTFSELGFPYDLGEIKALDVRNMVMEKELNLEEYTQLAYKWAGSVWDAWKDYHSAIRNLYETYYQTSKVLK